MLAFAAEISDALLSRVSQCAGKAGRADPGGSARRRGVIFDIGHGSGSFGFRTAEAMLAAGFPPDVISTDVHALSVKGPAFDQLVTMSEIPLPRNGADRVQRTNRCLTVEIAVGTPITGRPPHRTVRAAFLHTAPTSDD